MKRMKLQSGQFKRKLLFEYLSRKEADISKVEMSADAEVNLQSSLSLAQTFDLFKQILNTVDHKTFSTGDMDL